MSDALLTRIAEALEKLVHHTTSGTTPAAAPEKATKTKKAEKVTEATPTPAAVTSAPAAAAPAPVTVVPAATAAAPAGADLVTQTANAVIDLANNYSRDAAVAAMAKYGAQKVSQVKPENLAGLLADVTAAIAAEKAKKANESLV